jgi:hypothetical protein
MKKNLYSFNSAIVEDRGDSISVVVHKEMDAFDITDLASRKMSPLPLQKTPQD